MTTLPSAASTLVKNLADGWTHHATTARGPIEVSYYGDPRSDGTRPTLTRPEDVDSVLVRFCHAATRRAVVALWVRRDGKGWTLDTAIRGRHAKGSCECPDRAHRGEHVPQRLDAGQLGAYLSAASPADFVRRVDELAAKRAAAVAKAAATRAAKKSQQISTSGDTEEAA